MFSKSYHWLRRPRTTAEKRANQDGWGRAKRRSSRLPSWYDDIPIHYEKSWKRRRKTQYRPKKRGKHHQYVLKDNIFVLRWKFKDYCETHDVPYNIQEIKSWRWLERRKMVETPYKTYKWVGTGEYFRSYYTDGYILHWWSDKDIGIEYIVRA